MPKDAIDDFFEEAPPSASMIESVRSFGYTLNTAVCDIIDNSVSAGAKNINIRLYWNEGDPWLAIVDDGHGMTENELKKNMVLCSTPPDAKREKTDLGRFGLGMKSASFAMARQLNVFSKTSNSGVSFRQWDLDVVAERNQWSVFTKIPDWYEGFDEEYKIGNSGTIIIWKKADRLLKIAPTPQGLSKIITNLSEYVGAVFSRFLSGKSPIKMQIMEHRIVPWDPVAGGRTRARQVMNSGLTITPYVMPHQSAYDDQAEFKRLGGLKGWNAQQGIYIYRRDRLIVNGGWLSSKMKNDEHTKLARIIFEIGSESDLDWQVDILKSRVTPPGDLMELIDAIARDTRKDAEDVYRQRGKVTARTHAQTTFIWKTRKKDDGSLSFQINREHPYIQYVHSKYQGPGKEINQLLTMIETYLPAETIQIEQTKGAVFLHPSDLEKAIDTAEKSLNFLMQSGKSRNQALEVILSIEPFSEFTEEIRLHLGL